MATQLLKDQFRSENGMQIVSKNTTGAITVTSGDKMKNEAVGSAGIEGTAETYYTSRKI